VPRIAPEHLGMVRRGQAVLFVAETRAGTANIVRRSVLPDPRSVVYNPRKKPGEDVLNDSARVIAEARHWMAGGTKALPAPALQITDESSKDE
jgi:hypothetical protein